MAANGNKSWDRPDGGKFADWLNSRVARLAERTYDWDALKFQADYDPKYRRAQMRYVGTGATGIAADTNTVPAGNFTFSTMVLPPHAEGPLHIHMDVEEVFFVMRGQKVKMIAQENQNGHASGDKWEAIVGERDLISWPPGVWRGVQNLGDEEVLMLVMLGSSKPETPSYPPDSPIAKLKRNPKR